MCIFYVFYGKKAYFFHNECADSTKPLCERKLFSCDQVYQNTEHVFFLFYDHY